MVQNTRWRAENPLSQVAFKLGRSRGGQSGNKWNTLENFPQYQIPISNKLEELESDTDLAGSGDVEDLGEVDKENINSQNIQGGEERTEQVIFESERGKPVKRKIAKKSGPKKRWAGKSRVSVAQEQNVQKGPNWHMRGLIFTLTRAEVERSESGKRLRVEFSSERRSGGVFVDRAEGEYASYGTPPEQAE
ncbi:unnamed protein product [Microthlaspi erraticum]|uniref:Uncharacterized protein n=1 Tax=Microthlaspi erraticum TaxID=1685480 RepID=A0A6D2IDP0_9BRAS|nr:unnamed protein product [Microthlaspi erraticum]